MGSLGLRHRLVLDLLAAPYAGVGGTGEKGRLWYGIGALVGYEWMASYGLAIRSTVGVAYRPTLPGETVNLAVNFLSLDYKFW